VEQVIGSDIRENYAGILPSDITHANSIARMRELDAQILGLFITRAAILDVSGQDFADFMKDHVEALGRILEKHPIPVQDWTTKVKAR